MEYKEMEGKVTTRNSDMERLLKLMASCARKMKKTAAVMRFHVECHMGDGYERNAGIIEAATALGATAAIIRARIGELKKDEKGE